MDGDIEREPLIGPVNEVRYEDKVSGTRNRQKLCQSLDDGENHDLQVLSRPSSFDVPVDHNV